LATTENRYMRLTTAQALVRHILAQYIEVDGAEVALFGGVFAIFGHGNVSCLGEALYECRDILPTWRGQNEQSMGLAAVAYAKANLRRRICVATSSVGPGATNMVTAAGVAHTNRLPVLFIAGDVYHHRLPHPVLQQVEHFGDPTISVNDAFKPVMRYWDRISHPAQLIQSLPTAIATMLDPADCGPVFLGLPQDVQGLAYDFPSQFFERRVHRIRRPRPEQADVVAAAALLRKAKKPIIIAGGGVHYSLAQPALSEFSGRRNLPVVETIAGISSAPISSSLVCGTVGATGADSANTLVGEADVILAIGTRLQDFTTGSWTIFNSDAKIISLNVGRFDSMKHMALPFICDALEGIQALDAELGDWRTEANWSQHAATLTKAWQGRVSSRSQPNTEMPSYAQVIAKVNHICSPEDRVLTAAGGMPAEVSANWQSTGVGNVDIEFGFSCMGYEIAGGWGSRIAQVEKQSKGDTFVLVGDGSYLILNSDIYSSVLSGHKTIIVVCDNGGFAVIDKLQRNTGNESFNNLIKDCRTAVEPFGVDFAAHARSMGANAEWVRSISELGDALARARVSDRTYVIAIKVDPYSWSDESNAWWEVGIPEISSRPQIREARERLEIGRKRQRRGV